MTPKKIISIIGTIVGIMSIRYSFVIRKMSTGMFERELAYGGDAYTGIQNAAAQTANNVQDLTEVLRKGFSSVLLIVGLLAVCYFMAAFFEDMSFQQVKASAQGLSEKMHMTPKKEASSDKTADSPLPDLKSEGLVGRPLTEPAAAEKPSAESAAAPAGVKPSAESTAISAAEKSAAENEAAPAAEKPAPPQEEAAGLREQ